MARRDAELGPERRTMTQALVLGWVRAIHTAIYLVMASASFATLYAGVTGVHGAWLWLAGGLVAIEAVVFTASGGPVGGPEPELRRPLPRRLSLQGLVHQGADRFRPARAGLGRLRDERIQRGQPVGLQANADEGPRLPGPLAFGVIMS